MAEVIKGNESFLTPGAGQIQQSTPNNPAAGAGYTVVVPSGEGLGETWLLNTIAFSFTADANVANREAVIDIFQGGKTSSHIRLATAHTASQSFRYYFASGFPVQEALDSANNRMAWLWPYKFIFPNNTLSITFGGIQAGDQISDIVIEYQKWRTD
jgi:hypothetical protein